MKRKKITKVIHSPNNLGVPNNGGPINIIINNNGNSTDNNTDNNKSKNKIVEFLEKNWLVLFLGFSLLTSSGFYFGGNYYGSVQKRDEPKKTINDNGLKKVKNPPTEVKTSEVDISKSEKPKVNVKTPNKKPYLYKKKPISIKKKPQNNQSIQDENYENYRKSLDDKLRNRNDEKK
ncbi:hypothetical protein OX283_009525 [Flavobacterium sp. SUN052]|uniref:hypothetical protein n=1 Tax=Flavobacterium sp. SUN052 TaxID=3002441 RepID=UPI00237E03F7|nr:hypothetical protein [Flavobacterium sp. SUN052]MEC4004894.1 hypothetical protein [Flavobacterium sp. SUN052]